MPDFHSIVTEYWFKKMSGDVQHFENESFCLTINNSLDESNSIMVLGVVNGKTRVTLSSKVAEALMLSKIEITNLEQLEVYLAEKKLKLHGPDNLYYFSHQNQLKLLNESDKKNIRPLTSEDKNAFSQFERLASKDDLENAYVELEHWLVYGAFEGQQLVCAASMYDWDNTQFADIGVLTLDPFRGKGYAKKVISAMSKKAIQLGYEPQYRTQIDNQASIALANSLGLSLFAKWDVISPDCK
ncbi:GNAT family N-acetyltransferase [Providencia stuartii]|uniref:GNAT family N-acetyltransferase n=3 Tax=Providencia TaxID=586 RepID=A0AAI9D9G2_PROST|nr:GNAT family N-acetyltransferase [Providencia sp. 2023EL-00965]ELR5111456.1 GNAT family N-acetyltransferase [Providencia stuartii]ELR5298388.1 GNAT family N-acetyltransferase [Providencia stuartii]MDW7586834.1 GNAT family N-acetyltransferase [Providencia sp. 2023EL-00965]